MSEDMSATSRFKPGEGDWICEEESCRNVNFAKRQKCNKCGSDRSSGQEFKKTGSEIGKVMAEKSRGLFSADDWMCKACGNVNWARRSTCNICNAPKFGNCEPRTGYGGGYMERELNVQYKDRDDSDNEFDEFGRKKKRFRGSLPQTGILDEKKPNDQEEEEDDDDDNVDVSKYQLESEEEDDEDADLSKYKLSDDSEDEEPTNNDVKNDKSLVAAPVAPPRSSRSSSYSSTSSSSSRSRSRSRKKSHRSRSRSKSRDRTSKRRSRHRHRDSRSRSRSHERRRSRSRS